MSEKPYCIWCDQNGHLPTDGCQQRCFLKPYEDYRARVRSLGAAMQAANDGLRRVFDRPARHEEEVKP